MARDLLDRLADIVRPVLSDADIVSGASLSDGGFVKIAARLGISPDETKLLFRSLVTRLRSQQDRIAEAAAVFGDLRFTVEPDAMGNATVRDTVTGRSVLLRGSDASAAMDAADAGQGGQERLSSFLPMMEDQDDERPHWEAKRETGFYGRQGAGSIVLALDTGRILLGLRSHGCEQPGTWNGFGGAIDSGEDPKEAARREIIEELGYRGPVQLLPLYVFRSGTFRYSNFLAVVEHEFAPHLNWEHDDADWFEWGDWPEPLHFGFKAILGDANSVHTIEDILAQRNPQNVTESAEILDEADFSSEIGATPLGTFNFPWVLGSRHGLATARFRGHGSSMSVSVLSVRDSNGQKIADVDGEAIADQARAYIGQE